MIDSNTSFIADTLSAFKNVDSNISTIDKLKEYFNLFAGLTGIIGTIIAIVTLQKGKKTKKLQDYLLEKAKIALESEDAESKLKATKQELSNVESKINTLQDQIQKELPLQARRAVLSDRLDESFENLQKYYSDVINTKAKLRELGINSNISDELLKNIETEIEPKYKLKEKISNNQIGLTITSTISGIFFVAVPYPFGNYIGLTILILGIPFLFQVARYTLIKNSQDKQKASLTLKLFSILLATILTIISSVFSWVISYSASRYSIREIYFFIAIGISLISMLLVFYTIKTYKNYKNSTATN